MDVDVRKQFISGTISSKYDSNFRKNYSLFNEIDFKLEKTISLFHVLNDYEILFITDDDEVYYYFSFDNHKELKGFDNLHNKKIIKFSSSYTNYFALSRNGSVYSWGTNKYGQLGTGNSKRIKDPILIQDLINIKVKDICCGIHHTLLLANDGNVIAFGRNNFGQIGNGSNLNQLIPVFLQSELLKSSKVKSISCGLDHSVALNENGEVFVLGDNSYGQLGIQSYDKQKLPKQIKVLLIKQIVCGRFSLVMLSSIGDIYFCGFVTNQLNYNYPIKINNSMIYKEVAASPDYYLCLALSDENICFVYGLCEKGKFENLTKTKFTSLDEAFMFYLSLQCTFRNITITNQNNFNLYDDLGETTEDTKITQQFIDDRNIDETEKMVDKYISFLSIIMGEQVIGNKLKQPLKDAIIDGATYLVSGVVGLALGGLGDILTYGAIEAYRTRSKVITIQKALEKMPLEVKSKIVVEIQTILDKLKIDDIAEFSKLTLNYSQSEKTQAENGLRQEFKKFNNYLFQNSKKDKVVNDLLQDFKKESFVVIQRAWLEFKQTLK